MDLLDEVIEQFQSIYNKNLEVLEQQSPENSNPDDKLHNLYQAYWASNQKLLSTLRILKAFNAYFKKNNKPL